MNKWYDEPRRFYFWIDKENRVGSTQAGNVNEIFEGTSLIGNANKDKITSLIVEKVGVSEEQADQIYNAAMDILKNAVVDKINPFKK